MSNEAEVQETQEEAVEEASETQVDAAAENGEEKKARPPRRTGPAPEKAKQAGEVSEALLKHMGLESVVVEVTDGEEEITVKIEDVEGSTEIVDLFSQSRPPAIPAFQFLLNKIVNRFPEDRKHIMVDVPAVPKKERSAPQRRERTPPGELDPDLDPTLVALGRMLAERAQTLDRVLTVYPMMAADRRAIHQTVTVTEGASTVSDGDGLYRRLHVVPASMAPAPARKRRRRRRRRRPEGEERNENGAETGGEVVEAAEATEAPEVRETP